MLLMELNTSPQLAPYGLTHFQRQWGGNGRVVARHKLRQIGLQNHRMGLPGTGHWWLFASAALLTHESTMRAAALGLYVERPVMNRI